MYDDNHGSRQACAITSVPHFSDLIRVTAVRKLDVRIAATQTQYRIIFHCKFDVRKVLRVNNSAPKTEEKATVYYSVRVDSGNVTDLIIIAASGLAKLLNVKCETIFFFEF
jgi:hypothetical protein